MSVGAVWSRWFVPTAASDERLLTGTQMAPHSVRHSIEEEGTNFRDIVEAERRQLAVQLLQGTQKKLDEIALQLG